MVFTRGNIVVTTQEQKIMGVLRHRMGNFHIYVGHLSPHSFLIFSHQWMEHIFFLQVLTSSLPIFFTELNLSIFHLFSSHKIYNKIAHSFLKSRKKEKYLVHKQTIDIIFLYNLMISNVLSSLLSLGNTDTFTRA